VYRARDTRLGRDHAIKLLPAEVAQDRERLARFRREAHLLASLNHPHIAATHGLEELEGKLLLVLEHTIALRANELVVVQNWFEEVCARLRAAAQ